MPIERMSRTILPPQAVDTAAEVDQLRAVGEQAELPHERDDLSQDRGDGRTADAPPEAVDEQRVEHGVDDHGVDRGVHRLARMPRGPQHGVQPQVHVCHDITGEDDRHVLARIADRRLAGAEEVEDWIEEELGHETEADTEDQVQHHDIAQHILGRGIVTLAEAHRHERRGAHADQRTERRGEVHQREGERKARDGQRAHPVPDEDAVHHVVERRSRHGHDSWYGILHEQLADALRTEGHRRRFELCFRHKILRFNPLPAPPAAGFPFHCVRSRRTGARYRGTARSSFSNQSR